MPLERKIRLKMSSISYDDFLAAPSARAWKTVGLRRRAGVAAPLFSLQSAHSAGIGEIPDLETLSLWCAAAGLSLIQLLPLNDTGFDFSPYSAQSAYALDPVYISLEKVRGTDPAPIRAALRDLRRRYSGLPRVDYGVKIEKLALLRKLFDSREHWPGEFRTYCAAQRSWLTDYALYKTLKTRLGQKSWENWPDPLKNRDPRALDQAARSAPREVRFHQWLQWQVYEQMKAAKETAAARGVLFMGDLPFLTSRDSADVWAHPGRFQLDLSSGAPPDLFFSRGQRWGMPPQRLEDPSPLTDKLSYARHFYDLYRIDHVIGLFRLYCIPTREPAESAGLNGSFDPADESRWESRGRQLLGALLEAAPLLPIGEDLGVVPPCATRVMGEMAIPGLEVVRWTRDWGHDGGFLPPERYRRNAVAVLSTHDMSVTAAWWSEEAQAEERDLYTRFLGMTPEECAAAPTEVIRRSLEKAHRSAAIFSIQLLPDYLAAASSPSPDPRADRINTPGTVGPGNWSWRCPLRLENLLNWPGTDLLRRLTAEADRL
jgi:4-alpha-glucanotransferase